MRRGATSAPVVALRDAREGVGAKAAVLGKLARAGLPVPRGWVLPEGAYVQALEAAGLLEAARRGEHARLAEAVLRIELPFTMPILAARLAVRSSAADEDTAEEARAGAYRTVLDVPAEGVPDAIRAVWASWHAAQAQRPAQAPSLPRMSVLLMEMVEPRCAGVMFTVHPLTGSWAEMVVEAVWGLGEALVGGHVMPDRYVVRRPRGALARRLPARVMARALRAVDVAVAPQERELGRTRSGKAGWIPCEAPGARKLGTAQVEALCRLGIRVERLMGCPQDVEWAEDRAGRLVLLQARPVTARAELPRGGKTIWTRRFVGERWPRGVTPLGWSLLEPELTHLVSYPRTSARLLGGDPPFRVVQGHPYVNVTVFRHLAFKLPGAPPPRFMLELLPPDDVRRWTHRMGAPPDFAVLGAILRETAEDRRWRRFSWNPWTNPRDWAAFVKRLDQELPALEAAPPEEALPRARPLLRAYVGIHVVSLLFAHLGWEVLSPRLGAEADVLLQPPHGSVTARVNAELRAVAMLSGPAREERLADFLARHGHRADESWEIWSPRWQEHPARVLALAEAMRPHTAPALDTAEARLEELPPPLRAATRLARTYLGFREEQRYHLERLLWRLKQQLRALGARWLEDPEDTRFLRVEEIEAGLEGALDPTVIRATAARRAREHAAEDPPEFLEGDAALPVVEEASARIQGLGVSPGLARGRARVLRRPEEGRLLRDGEILVVPSSDPGWTPLLYRAGGLVLELGSQLGHGAIVARELRLPAVANVPHATHRFRDGEELSLDGRSGVVWRHDGP